MVPVGRLTLVRTFAKSDLIRVMSYVAIPALIGPIMSAECDELYERVKTQFDQLPCGRGYWEKTTR